MASFVRARSRWIALFAAALAVLALTNGYLSARPGAASGPGAEPQVQVEGELAAIRELIDEANQAYDAGERDQAFRLARAAYLDHFELVEIPLRVVDPDGTLAMEYQFAEWRAAIKDGAPATDVRVRARELERELQRVQTMLVGAGVAAPSIVTGASFSILFREGLEALLVVAALMSYLKTQNPGLRKPLVLGALLAVPASLATWFVLDAVLSVAPVGRELLEALVSLAAAATMFYVSFWLLNRLDVRHWMEFLKARVWGAVATGSAGTLAVLGFLSVYREGAETALFFQALSGLATGLEIWVGIGALLAAAALAAIGGAIFYLGARLPLRWFFTFAMVLVMAVSIAVVGNAVRELQVIGWMPLTSLVDSMPRFNRYVTEFLGIHPTVQTIAAQAALLAVYVCGAAVFILRLRRSRQASARVASAPMAANREA